MSLRRFDNALMQAPQAHGPVPAPLLQALRTWCEAGAFPHFSLPLAAARIGSPAGLDAAACELDGSHALARLGRWQGLLWRLQILLRDAGRASARQGDPWDCGWWRSGPLDMAAAFRPRRPTLLLVPEADTANAAALLAVLLAQSAAYARPLRVLVVSRAPVADLASL